MRAVLRLESIGDGLQVISKAIASSDIDRIIKGGYALGSLRGRVYDYAMLPPARPWVARIIGFDEKFKYHREFVRGTKDYSETSGTMNRGVFYWFTLECGLYDVFEHISWKHQRRYFCEVIDDVIREISEEELIQCLNLRSELASTSLSLPDSESHGPSTPFHEST